MIWRLGVESRWSPLWWADAPGSVVGAVIHSSDPRPGAHHDHRAGVTDRSASTLAVRPRTTLSARRPWLAGTLLLAGAAQLITIAALLSADPLAVTLWSLLLAIAPAPLAAVAAFAPTVLARAAAAALAVVLIAGTAGGITHTGLVFLPAIIVLGFGGRALMRART